MHLLYFGISLIHPFLVELYFHSEMFYKTQCVGQFSTFNVASALFSDTFNVTSVGHVSLATFRGDVAPHTFLWPGLSTTVYKITPDQPTNCQNYSNSLCSTKQWQNKLSCLEEHLLDLSSISLNRNFIFDHLISL